MRRMLLTLALVLVSALHSLAQNQQRTVTLRLQNGQVLTGVLKYADSDVVSVVIDGVGRTFRADDVKAIEFGAMAPAASRYGLINWTFPKPGMRPIEVEGKRLYKLGESVYGEEGELGEFQIRKIYIPAKIIELAELAHSQDPNKMPDVNKFLTALAVSWAVEAAPDSIAEYLGNGVVLGRRMYFYKAGNGSNVAAAVSDNGKMVLIMPAPLER